MTNLPLAPWSANWIIHRPDAHPAWDDYFVYMLSLEDIPGLGPAHKYAEDRTHELAVFALDPEGGPLPYGFGKLSEEAVFDLRQTGALKLITPPNYIFQFRFKDHAVAEQFAVFEVIEPLVTYRLNPDTDFRSSWEIYFFQVGGISGRSDQFQELLTKGIPDAD